MSQENLQGNKGHRTTKDQLTVSYPLKLPQSALLNHPIRYLQQITLLLSSELLDLLWSKQTLDLFQQSSSSSSSSGAKLKSYKILEESVVQQTRTGAQLYLPSRMKRALLEQVGRVIRSQVKRRECWNDVLKVVQLTGLEGNLDKLVKTVFLTLGLLHGKFYKYVLIRQHLRTLRRYYYKTGVDVQLLQSLDYTQFVRPRIRRFIIPYAVDDGQIFRLCEVQHRKSADVELAIQLKLPLVNHPTRKKDWHWFSTTVVLPADLSKRMQNSCTDLKIKKIHRPTLRMVTLKGGLELPFMEFPFTLQTSPDQRNCKWANIKKNRIMAVDLGVINLSSSVIFDAGEQISTPSFFSVNKSLYRKIEKFYGQIKRLQRKLKVYRRNWSGQRRRQKEFERLVRKTNHIRKDIVHQVSNHILGRAMTYGVETIVLEDLRNYLPPKHKKRLSRKLSDWLRGSVYELLVYKLHGFGIKLTRINPRNTSTYCPRCGLKGQKIIEPEQKEVWKGGRFFHCPSSSCGYTADRDYIACLNIYRKYQAKKKNIYSIKQAKTVSYTGAVPRPIVHGGNPNRFFSVG
jgi:IS605 OrfB family transposase